VSRPERLGHAGERFFQVGDIGQDLVDRERHHRPPGLLRPGRGHPPVAANCRTGQADSLAKIRMASLAVDRSSLPDGFVPPYERISSTSMAASRRHE
jgi:hypothetical protein